MIKPNWVRLNKKLSDIESRNSENNIFGHIDGFDFSIIMQSLLVSEHGYIMDTGNWENANYVCVYELIKKIKKHPILWRLFMLA